jgi:SagB-type dehydrogenase family enzyme
MQVQQNTCERIYKDQPLRPSVRAQSPAIRFDSTGFNPQSVIVRRRSTRRFNGDPIPSKDVEDMLRFAFREEGHESRLAPGRLEFHVAVLAVEDREPGIYSLNAETLEWTLKKAGDFREEIMGICLGQELGRDCAFALLYTSDMSALVSTYGDRGYRYACLDAGQIGERIQLWALHKGFGSSGIGGYYDDWANEVFGLPLSHGVLYLTVTGVPEGE